jgi:hypothetical protein
MATVEVTLLVTVEAKHEYEQGAGSLPLPGEVARQIADDLHYQTRDDWTIPWMVRRVEEVPS